LFPQEALAQVQVGRGLERCAVLLDEGVQGGAAVLGPLACRPWAVLMGRF
jgi:hypothetical protein